MIHSEKTRQIISDWFAAIGRGDMATIISTLSEDIEFELPQNDYNRIIPYLGVHRGRAAVEKAFRIRAETTDVEGYVLRELTVQDNRACAIIWDKMYCRATGVPFEIEDMHRLEVNDAGYICKWRVYFDPTPAVRAFAPALAPALVAAVEVDDLAEVDRLLQLGADPHTRHPNGLTVLMVAAAHGNAPIVKRLLEAGADPLTMDRDSGTPVFNKACQGGSLEAVKLLAEAGAFTESISTTTGHSPLMDAVWFSRADIVEYLLEQGVGLNTVAHYGFTLKHHMDFERNVNKGKNAVFDRMDAAIAARAAHDQALAEEQRLLAAVAAGDLAEVKRLIAAGEPVDRRAPITNTFNDGHTPLLVAARDGHTEIVAELLKAGSDVNAEEPTFCAVPLHKAVYNGRADITRMLVAQPGVNLNVQGATNGYTPLHDALWHRFHECAQILLDAGARADLRGHDGKTPLDVAREHLPANAGIIRQIEAKLRDTAQEAV